MKRVFDRGLYTALITPFKNNKVDYDSLAKLLDFQMKNRVKGVVVFGTTGEGSTLSLEEKQEILKFTLSYVKNTIRVIASIGTNNTAHAQEMAQKFAILSPDAFLVLTPYYSRTTQEGLYQHFQKVAISSDLPIILYNIPKRTGIDISDDTIIRLCNMSNIIGLKDATGEIARVSSLKSKVTKEFLLFSGDDFTSLAFNSSGGDGSISAVSNIIPGQMNELQELSLASINLEAALALQNKIFTIASTLFMETNPIPVKYACFLKNLCQNEYRLPLVEPSAHVKEKIKEILAIC